MALIHNIFHLRHVPSLPVPLPHHSMKANISRDIAMPCMPQQCAETVGILILSVTWPLPTLDQDLPSVYHRRWASQTGLGSSVRNPKLLLMPLHLSDPLMLLSLSHTSLGSGQMSLELNLFSHSDQIPPGHAGSASPGHLCLTLWLFVKPGLKCNPDWASTTHLLACGTPRQWPPVTPVQQVLERGNKWRSGGKWRRLGERMEKGGKIGKVVKREELIASPVSLLYADLSSFCL